MRGLLILPFLVGVAFAGDAPEDLPNVSSAMDLAQVCPVGPKEALTAKHVAETKLLLWGYPGELEGGTLEWLWIDRRRDVAAVRIVEGPPFRRYYPLSSSTLTVGDRVWVMGYDRDKGFTSRWVRAKVLHIFAGHITLDGTPGRGSSGSCVLNEALEIVAINSGGYRRGIGEDPNTGVGVLVIGPWTPPGDERWIERRQGVVS